MYVAGVVVVGGRTYVIDSRFKSRELGDVNVTGVVWTSTMNEDGGREEEELFLQAPLQVRNSSNWFCNKTSFSAVI